MDGLIKLTVSWPAFDSHNDSDDEYIVSKKSLKARLHKYIEQLYK